MKNKKILIMGIVVMIIITIGIVGVLYFTTDLFKTNQQLFYKYIGKIQIVDGDFLKQYSVAVDKITKNSNSSITDISISNSIQNQETGIANVQNILNVKSNGLENTLTKQSYRDFTFSSNNQNLLTLKYMRDNNIYAIGADNILAKYLAIENSNLKAFFFKLGLEDTSNIPDSIQTNYEEIFKIDAQTQKYLKETYGTLIYNNINKESFYKIKNQDKTETIGITLSEQELINVLKAILENAKNDMTLLNLISTKAQQLNYSNITIENIQLKIQNILEESANNTYSTEKDFIKLSLIKKEKNIIGINLETNYIETEDYRNSINDGFTQVDQKTNNKIQIDFSEENKIVINGKENNNELFNIIINYTYNNNELNYYIESKLTENEEINILKIQYQISNFQSDNINQKTLIDISLNNEDNYQVNINNNVTLKQDVIISKLTTENSAKLNDMTSEEISQLFTAIVARVMYLYGQENNNL